MFGLGPTQISDTLFGEKRSMIYIFAPSQTTRLSPVAHRPLRYNFTEEFAIGATQAVENVYSNTSNSAIRGFLQSPTASSVALPGLHPDTMLNMDLMSNSWRFVMILDNPPIMTGGMAAPSSGLTEMRVIVMGYFIDEPVNPMTMFTAPVVNPQSTLIITHKTIVEKMNSYGGNGAGTPTIMTRVDEQIVQGEALNNLASTPMCYIDPVSSYDGLSYTTEGVLTLPSAVTNSVAAANNGVPKAINSRFQIPQANVNHILNTAVNSYRDMMAEQTTGMMHVDSHGGFPGISGGAFNEYMRENMAARPHPSSMAGPNEGEILTLQATIQRWHPEIKIYAGQQSHMYSAMDASGGNPVNVFSDLMCSSIPPLMSKYGIASIVMHYSSFVENTAMALDDGGNDGYQIGNISWLLPMPESLQKSRIDLFINELRKTVFQTTKFGHGDFYVDLSVNFGGMAQIQLSFMCDHEVTQAPFEKPLCLDGLYTSMVGDTAACDQNVSQIKNLMGALANDYHTPGYAQQPYGAAPVEMPQPPVFGHGQAPQPPAGSPQQGPVPSLNPHGGFTSNF